MTYFLVNDDFYDHPKVKGTPDSALGLWVRAGSYSGRYLTDGHIATDVLNALRDRHHHNVTRDAHRLADSGLWEPAKGGWQVHDWADHQTRLREDVLRDREAAKMRMRETRRLRMVHGGRDDSEFDDPRFGINGPPRAGRQEQIPGGAS